jgi:hypothetical protein
MKHTVKTIKTLTLTLLALAVAIPAVAQPSRLYDKDVKQLLDQVKQSYERYWDALDNQVKNTTFKGPAGEFIVKRIDEDYRKTIDTAKARFGGSSSASSEVGAILRDAGRTQTYVTEKGSAMKGASEWQAHTTVLAQLAAQYGGTYPPAENQVLSRHTDMEVISAATAIEASSKQLASALENALKKDKATPEATRKAMVADVKLVGENAKILASAVKDEKPASAHVKALTDQVKKVQDAIGASSAAAAVTVQSGRLNAPLKTINSAFNQQ